MHFSWEELLHKPDISLLRIFPQKSLWVLLQSIRCNQRKEMPEIYAGFNCYWVQKAWITAQRCSSRSVSLLKSRPESTSLAGRHHLWARAVQLHLSKVRARNIRGQEWKRKFIRNGQHKSRHHIFHGKEGLASELQKKTGSGQDWGIRSQENSTSRILDVL